MYLDVEYSPVIFCSDINAYTLNKERHKANTVVQGERLRHISRHPWSFSILKKATVLVVNVVVKGSRLV
jgi:hypothetical protein